MKRKIKKLYLLFCSLLLIGMASPIPVHADLDSELIVSDSGGVTLKNVETSQDSAFAKMLKKYKKIVIFISSLATLTMLGVLIINFTKLAGASGNPTALQKAKTAIIWSLIATGLLGGASTFLGIFYGLFK